MDCAEHIAEHGHQPIPVRLLSFLTFAGGGVSGGLLGAVGGAVGKGVFAYFAAETIIPLFSRGTPLKGMGTGVKNLLSSFSVKGKSVSPCCWVRAHPDGL
jgi:hypothetical protein